MNSVVFLVVCTLPYNLWDWGSIFWTKKLHYHQMC